jgi:hypothetical protein
MFNLMRYYYRKVNCFTPTDLLSIVNRHPQVNAIPMEADDFLDWDKLENTTSGCQSRWYIEESHLYC